MATRYGRNFTSFQNISLQGSPSADPVNVGMFELAPGATQEKSTISISMIGSGTDSSVNSANEHPYFHISNAGLSIGTGFIRLTAVGSSPYTTIRARASTYLDSDVALTLPAKSGVIPIAGTFAVQLKGPGASENSFSTIVTVAGVRLEDALIVQVNRGNAASSGYDLIGANSGSTAFILTSAKPGNGNITLMFYNALGATNYVDLQCSYIAMR